MPVTEAVSHAHDGDVVAYELAFHILPTVTEGEVATVNETVKNFIKNHGGEIFDEETPARFELAYEIEKYLEGKYRRFASAYFGWVRFRVTGSAIAPLLEDIEGEKHLLRHLLVRLTKVEEANPFRFHESIKDTKITNIDLDEVVEGEEAEGEAVDVEAEAAVEGEEVK